MIFTLRLSNAKALVLTLMVLCSGQFALCAAVDLRTGAPLDASAEVALFEIPKRLHELDVLKQEVRSELEQLPYLNQPLQYEGYGYHGGYFPILDGLIDEPRWTLDFSFNRNILLSQVILVPALDHRANTSESYGFPRRFRVSTIAADGSVNVIQEWIHEDCPDPGRYPLIIDASEPRAYKVRLEVFRGEVSGDREVFALDELYGVMGLSEHPCERVEASSAYTSLPYWGTEFVIDQKTSLGLPLHVKAENAERPAESDFVVSFESDPEPDCVVELDLGRNRKLGWVALFPAQSPSGMLIPDYGFPGNIRVELVRQTKAGGRADGRMLPREWIDQEPGQNVVAFNGGDLNARWIRIHMGDFPTHNQQQTFALGEINVYRLDTLYPIEAIRLEGFPAEAEADVDLLRDGKVGGHPVLFLLDWLNQLQERKQLKRLLENCTVLGEQLEARWNSFWRILLVDIAVLVSLIAVLFAIIQGVLRRRHSAALRRQVNSDLHDDIGSKVAAISLASAYVERSASEPMVRERGARIRTIAADMHHGLRDVLWLTDAQTDTLDHVMQKLADSVRVSIPAEQLELHATPPGQVPSTPVKLQVKRDLLLFLKEVLHNAASHAHATRIEVEVALVGRTLYLKVKDNGQGFNMKEYESFAPGHHGRRTMRERAQRLNGVLTVDSSTGKGTLVELKVQV
ncbi:Unannotated [Lentimonas sp. CC4]|nr:Unannotated [Lentimonas sp. CC4]CAA6683577.1 Unannotated [Lentimonas sp. CC6]CAA7077339.1 Unannotated [Lentimonas sp. CC4]CAA7170144.1 Unannotated [Lentimonas sp. CC21]CAA7182467.1 Unannotated [Lentimonas sp. CC8]